MQPTNDNFIFVFGSNREGRHGSGAAHTARHVYGARYGQARGLQGRSYGIVTTELRSDFPRVTLPEIHLEIVDFLTFARQNPSMTFHITRVGGGLAGFNFEKDIKPMFGFLPPNCFFIDMSGKVMP